MNIPNGTTSMNPKPKRLYKHHDIKYSQWTVHRPAFPNKLVFNSSPRMTIHPPPTLQKIIIDSYTNSTQIEEQILFPAAHIPWELYTSHPPNSRPCKTQQPKNIYQNCTCKGIYLKKYSTDPQNWEDGERKNCSLNYQFSK